MQRLLEAKQKKVYVGKDTPGHEWLTHMTKAIRAQAPMPADLSPRYKPHHRILVAHNAANAVDGALALDGNVPVSAIRGLYRSMLRVCNYDRYRR